MKTFFVAAFISLLPIGTILAQTEDDIIGKWVNSNGNEKIEIVKKDEKYFGRIIWVKHPNDVNGNPVTDTKNPKRELRTRPILNLEIYRDLKYKGRNVWGSGTVYEFKSGKTYNCQMTLHNDKRLDIRAFFGITLLGRTETWQRSE